MTYIDFALEATTYYEKNKANYRFGQAVFNKLKELRPDIANRLVGTDLDPYYKRAIVDPVWVFIHENW